MPSPATDERFDRQLSNALTIAVAAFTLGQTIPKPSRVTDIDDLMAAADETR